MSRSLLHPVAAAGASSTAAAAMTTAVLLLVIVCATTRTSPVAAAYCHGAGEVSVLATAGSITHSLQVTGGQRVMIAHTGDNTSLYRSSAPTNAAGVHITSASNIDFEDQIILTNAATRVFDVAVDEVEGIIYMLSLQPAGATCTMVDDICSVLPARLRLLTAELDPSSATVTVEADFAIMVEQDGGGIMCESGGCADMVVEQASLAVVGVGQVAVGLMMDAEYRGRLGQLHMAALQESSPTEAIVVGETQSLGGEVVTTALFTYDIDVGLVRVVPLQEASLDRARLEVTALAASPSQGLLAVALLSRSGRWNFAFDVLLDQSGDAAVTRPGLCMFQGVALTQLWCSLSETEQTISSDRLTSPEAFASKIAISPSSGRVVHGVSVVTISTQYSLRGTCPNTLYCTTAARMRDVWTGSLEGVMMQAGVSRGAVQPCGSPTLLNIVAGESVVHMWSVMKDRGCPGLRAAAIGPSGVVVSAGQAALVPSTGLGMSAVFDIQSGSLVEVITESILELPMSETSALLSAQPRFHRDASRTVCYITREPRYLCKAISAAHALLGSHLEAVGDCVSCSAVGMVYSEDSAGDAVCIPCQCDEPGEYASSCPSDAGRTPVCTSCTRCGSSELVGQVCGLSEDTVCEECPSGEATSGDGTQCIDPEMLWGQDPSTEVECTFGLMRVGSLCIMECPAGFYFEESIGVCRPCSAGSISVAGLCVQCSAGTFNPQDAGGTCWPCPHGTTAGAGAVVCTTCPIGWSTDGVTCVPCPSGQFQSGVGGACQGCQPGSYLVGVLCVTASVNEYVHIAGAVSATPCPEGMVSDAGAVTCLPCPQGEYVLDGVCTVCVNGATNSAGTECISCVGALLYDAASGSCLPCALGTYLPDGSTVCQPIPGGMEYDFVARMVIPCRVGYYCPGEGGITIVECPGFHFCPGRDAYPAVLPSRDGAIGKCRQCSVCPAPSESVCGLQRGLGRGPPRRVPGRVFVLGWAGDDLHYGDVVPGGGLSVLRLVSGPSHMHSHGNVCVR